jgi:hypothetical protein
VARFHRYPRRQSNSGGLAERVQPRPSLGGLEEGAESLAQFARTVNLRAAGQPSFLAVLTGANVYATRRPDGIDVIPIAVLGP